jgi:uncharacterized membrane protein YhaH (DUF805 family)
MMWGRTHSPKVGLSQTITALVRMNNWLFAWPICVLVPLAVLFRPFRDRRIAALLALSAIQLSGYFFLAFGSVHDFGSAYHVWHLPWFATTTAWVVLRATDLLEQRATGRGRFALFVPLGLSLVGLATFWPIQVTRWAETGDVVMDPVRAAAQATAGKRAIILWSQIQPPGRAYRSWVFRPPAPHPSDQVLWAAQRPGIASELLARYPDRELFRLTWEDSRPKVVPAFPRPASADPASAERDQ